MNDSTKKPDVICHDKLPNGKECGKNFGNSNGAAGMLAWHRKKKHQK